MTLQLDAAVRAADLRKTYGQDATAVAALRGVSLTVPRGQLLAVMGPSGSGKSTLLQCLAGLDRFDAGQAWIDDVEITGLSDADLTRLRRDRIGFVFQAFNLLPALTVEQNVLLPLELAGTHVDRRWFEEVVGLLRVHDRLGHRPHELSGGQQQRVAVARALLGRPAVVFADEPTGNLDSVTAGEVLALLRESTTGLGQTVVMVTHDPVCAAYADRVVVLADGHLVHELTSPTVDAIGTALQAARSTALEEVGS